MSNSKESQKESYGQIVSSSSITGGAQAVSYLISIVKTKGIALLLGPSGVSLISLYTSLVELIESLTSLGIYSSGVREIAVARGNDNQEQCSQTFWSLKRASILIGLVGTAICIAFAKPISLLLFESADYARQTGIVGVCLFFTAAASCEKAILQGWQKISELAWSSVFAAGSSTLASLSIYYFFGSSGIVPALIAGSLFSYVCVKLFSIRIHIASSKPSWKSSYEMSKHLLGMGVAIAWTGILLVGVYLLIRSLIVRELGLDMNGIYQAAWGLSGMFSAFILSAMGMDFYPRLSKSVHDNTAMVRIVNQQIEIGLLMALPGLVATLVLSPWLIRVFYTSEFIEASQLLQPLVFGCLLQIFGWPLGFVARARRAISWVVVSETSVILAQLLFVLVLLPKLGLLGVALSFALFYLLYAFVMYGVARHLCGFSFTEGALRMTGIAIGACGLSLLIIHFAGETAGTVIGAALIILFGIFSARGIAHRLDENHRMVRLLSSIPGWRYLTK